MDLALGSLSWDLQLSMDPLQSPDVSDVRVLEVRVKNLVRAHVEHEEC